MFDERRIRKHGLPGQATVVSATEHSHLSSNDYRRYDFVLDVRPATGEPFRVEMHETFAILGLRPNEYDVVNVKYDPESHETIFDFTGDPRFDLDAMRARTTELRRETAEMNAVRAAGGGQPAFPFPQATAPRDAVAEIERLVALRDSGALSPAEFDAMKAKLIGPT